MTAITPATQPATAAGSPLLRLLRLARPMRARLLLAVLTGAAIAVFSAPGRLTPVPVAKAHSTHGTAHTVSQTDPGTQHAESATDAPTSRQ